jgi:glutamine amidotransferase
MEEKIKKKNVGILDLKSSNSGAVKSIIERTFPEIKVVMLSSKEHFDHADTLILPGVGKINSVMSELMTMNLVSAIIEFASSKRGILGICLGMQLLGMTSEEDDTTNCLGLLDYKTVKMESKSGFPVPHVGWNSVSVIKENLLTSGISEDTNFYFSHSFAVVQSTSVSATTSYGSDFASIVNDENIYGVQFHPEKSQKDGISVLSKFIKL